MDDRFNTYWINSRSRLGEEYEIYNSIDPAFMVELLKLKYSHDYKFIEDKMGKKIAEIVELINEVNNDVFNNSNNCRFELNVNSPIGRENYTYYLLNKLDTSNIKEIEVVLRINSGYTRIVSVIFTDLDKLTKNDVLDWMLSTIFKEELC